MDVNIPWVEKYRPQLFEEIILDEHNKTILTNILKLKSFCNLIFYGPPGTGKTTTIINLLKKYQNLNNEKGKDLIIHLNASDERGIDVIRNQIQSFVDSKTLFNNGHKFVILDEVDYMTKNAQQALRYLINNNKENVSFCLICNYISKIDISLREEFINIRFNQLPEKHIINFLKKIVIKEQLNIDENYLIKIQQYFNSDVRSMINYLQLNIIYENNFDIINKNIFKEITEIKDLLGFKRKIYETSVKYNIDRKKILYKLLEYKYDLTKEEKYLKIIISCMHEKINIDLLVNVIYYNL
jgi:DNA polymerase III delta prime subunit